MKFLIVNHCHLYGRLLAYQLSSMILHAPSHHQFDYILFHAPGDRTVLDVYDFYKSSMPKHVNLHKQVQPLQYLKNRAIGRNDAAKTNTADWLGS